MIPAPATRSMGQFRFGQHFGEQVRSPFLECVNGKMCRIVVGMGRQALDIVQTSLRPIPSFYPNSEIGSANVHSALGSARIAEFQVTRLTGASFIVSTPTRAGRLADASGDPTEAYNIEGLDSVVRRETDANAGRDRPRMESRAEHRLWDGGSESLQRAPVRSAGPARWSVPQIAQPSH